MLNFFCTISYVKRDCNVATRSANVYVLLMLEQLVRWQEQRLFLIHFQQKTLFRSQLCFSDIALYYEVTVPQANFHCLNHVVVR